jgi:two-component system CheB/CheR fusion protein
VYRDESGRVIGVFAAARDITERKRAEEELRHSMQTSDDIVRAIPSGFFIYQYEIPDRLILVSGNPEAERLTGISLKEWKGREFNEIWPEAKNAGITERYLTVM